MSHLRCHAAHAKDLALDGNDLSTLHTMACIKCHVLVQCPSKTAIIAAKKHTLITSPFLFPAGVLIETEEDEGGSDPAVAVDRLSLNSGLSLGFS